MNYELLNDLLYKESMFLKATGLRSSLDEKCLKRLDELVNKQEVEKKFVECVQISPLDSKVQRQVLTENNEYLFFLCI